jgi:hypothetical protein
VRYGIGSAASIYDAMVKRLPSHFWREMLEKGTHGSIAEIAAAEKINESCVGRVLRLTLLAPDIVEAILGWTEAVRGDARNQIKPGRSGA